MLFVYLGIDNSKMYSMQSDLKKILQLCYADGGTPEMLAYLLDLDNLREEFNKVVRDYYITMGATPYNSGEKQAFMMAYINDTPLDIRVNRLCEANRIKRTLTMQLSYVDVKIWYKKTEFLIVEKNTLCQQK